MILLKKIVLSEDEIEELKKHYSENKLSISGVAREMGYTRTVIKRVAKELGLKKNFPSGGTQGVRFNWTQERVDYLVKMYNSHEITVVQIAENLGTSEDTATKKAKELGLNKKTKRLHTKEDIEYIKDRAQSMSIYKIANNINLSHEFVRRKIKELGLTNLYYDKQEEKWALARRKEQERIKRYYENRKRPNIAPIHDDNFLWDLANPILTTYDIGKKYDLNPSTVGIWRKRTVGTMNARPEEFGKMTELEDKVAEVLINDFDLTFFFEYEIHGWNLDFYLGNKKAIETQGEFWHREKKTKDKDERKRKELEENGYSILYIEELDVYNSLDKVKEQILRFLQQ